MRSRIVNGVLAVGVIAVIGGSVGIAAADRRADAHDAVNAGPPAVSGLNSTAGHSVRPLSGGRWSALPGAPIVGRDPDVAVWTGTTMLVWGGRSLTGHRDYSDGATYDPATRVWATLPTSPLTARAEAAWVWTGRALFVWGGTDTHDHQLYDGAMYTPRTKRWTTLTPAPVLGYGTAQAVWTGDQVVLVTTPPGSHADHITARAYDPATGRWSTLPALRLRPQHDGMFTVAVAGAGRVYVWSHWAHSTKTHNGYKLTYGIDGYTLDLVIPARSQALNAQPAAWAASPFTWRGHELVNGPIWTGREILLPASQLWCGLCPGPYQPDSTGSRLDPSNGSDRVIRHGPADDQGGQYVWTGSVLLAANTQTTITGGGRDAYPGVTAFWRPSTNRWTRLPQAPMAGADAATVWTGHSLLIWGSLAPIHHQELLRTAGLELR